MVTVSCFLTSIQLQERYFLSGISDFGNYSYRNDCFESKCDYFERTVFWGNEWRIAVTVLAAPIMKNVRVTAPGGIPKELMNHRNQLQFTTLNSVALLNYYSYRIGSFWINLVTNSLPMESHRIPTEKANTKRGRKFGWVWSCLSSGVEGTVARVTPCHLHLDPTWSQHATSVRTIPSSPYPPALSRRIAVEKGMEKVHEQRRSPQMMGIRLPTSALIVKQIRVYTKAHRIVPNNVWEFSEAMILIMRKI